MKAESADGQNESTEARWPSVLRIPGDEFRQSAAVARLGVKLYEQKRAELETDLQKGSIIPERFLKEAWELIPSAHAIVLRQQTNAQYLLAHGRKP